MPPKKPIKKNDKKCFVIYSLAFLTILLSILVASYYYIESDHVFFTQNAEQESEIDFIQSQEYKEVHEQQTTKKPQEPKNEKISPHTGSATITIAQQEDQNIFNSDVSSDEDGEIDCRLLFVENLNINISKLLREVGEDIQSKQLSEDSRRSIIVKDLEQLTLKKLTDQQIKTLFQEREINLMEKQVKDIVSEGASDDDGVDGKTKDDSKAEEEKKQKQEKKKLEEKKEKDKNARDSSIKQLSTKDMQHLECFLDYYDKNEHLLSFDLVKYCEFIENEFIQLKWEGKRSLYDLMVHFYNVLHLSERTKITWQKSTQAQVEAVSNIFYQSKAVLNDLFQASKILPELFKYSDPEVEDLLEIKEALPMKHIVRNLVEVWEKNSVELGLVDTSHIAIKQKIERRRSFYNNNSTHTNTVKNMKVNRFSRADEDSTKQVNNSSQKKTPTYQKQQPNKKKVDEVNNIPVNTQTNMKQESNIPLNQNSQEKPQTKHKNQLDIELVDVFDDKKSEKESKKEEIDGQQNNNSENVDVNLESLFDKEEVKAEVQQKLDPIKKKNTKQEQKNQALKQKYKELDSGIPQYTELNSEEKDDLVSLENQIKDLWSDEWRNHFNNLQYNNFFLATKKTNQKISTKN